MPANPLEPAPVRVALNVRLSPELRRLVADAAGHAGMTVNAWVANALRLAARDGLGLPPPAPASNPLPDPLAAVTAWAAGERLLGPCGKRWPCHAESDLEDVDGVVWCVCGIRVV